MENTCNDPKQVLHRIDMSAKAADESECFQSEYQKQHPIYISVDLIDVDDLQSIFDSLPVIFVINGRHDGTLSLSERVNTVTDCE